MSQEGFFHPYVDTQGPLRARTIGTCPADLTTCRFDSCVHPLICAFCNRLLYSDTQIYNIGISIAVHCPLVSRVVHDTMLANVCTHCTTVACFYDSILQVSELHIARSVMSICHVFWQACVQWPAGSTTCQ